MRDETMTENTANGESKEMMLGLKERIRQFHEHYVERQPLPTSKVAKVARKIDTRFSALPNTPRLFDLDIVAAKFSHAIEVNEWALLTEIDWRWAPYLLFQEPYLALQEEFVARLMQKLDGDARSSTYKRLIFLYLQNFNKRNQFPSAFDSMAQAIRTGLEKYPLGLALWRIRHIKYDLFVAEKAVEKLTGAFLGEAKSNWSSFAELTGLQGELTNVGCAEEVGINLFSTTSLDEENMLQSVLSYHVENSDLRFKTQRVKFIERLLKPWTSPDSAIKEETRKQIQDLLLQRFGDPRLPSKRTAKWNGVRDNAVQVVFQWLAGKSLEQFFAIIDEKALEQQWKYRKAFWKAYYDKGLITEAWVAMGSDAAKTAQSIYGSAVVGATLHTSGYRDQTQSVLFLKIENLTFTVWSHNGKCRAWREGLANIPQLYKSEYTPSSLKIPSMVIVPGRDEGIAQMSSATYWWQRKLSEFIYQQTGIRMNERDYRI